MSAIISQCGLYRYRLERRISAAPRIAAFIMVNPSTADAKQNDATIRKVIGFAERNGIGKVIVGNKFAFRATDINALRNTTDPVGPENDHHLIQIMQDADLHIVAWGPLAKLPPNLRTRWQEVVQIADHVGCRFLCLGTAKDQHPRHPLMLSYDTAISDWNLPKLNS